MLPTKDNIQHIEKKLKTTTTYRRKKKRVTRLWFNHDNY